MISHLLAQVGTVQNPFSIMGGPSAYTDSVCGSGLFVILANLIKLSIVIAGLFAFVNFILAGYAFLSSSGDPKAISKAWEKISQSVLGLTVVAGSFILAGIVGWLIFRNYTALLTPRIYTPGTDCANFSGLPACTYYCSTSSECSTYIGGICSSAYFCSAESGGCCCMP
jgi:hypothetical protein